MIDMGQYFEPPPRSQDRTWQLLEAIAGCGYRFQAEGSRPYIYGRKHKGGREPSSRTVQARIRAILAEPDQRVEI